MCTSKPKTPEVKDPAPAPPDPNKSAGDTQGTPERQNQAESRYSRTRRNKLRIDLNAGVKSGSGLNIPTA